MHSPSNERVGLTLPRDVKPELLMEALTKGHGYTWLVLARRPALLVYGEASSRELPQLLFTGNSTLVVASANSGYIPRLRRIMEILQQQEEKQAIGPEGESVE